MRARMKARELDAERRLQANVGSAVARQADRLS